MKFDRDTDAVSSVVGVAVLLGITVTVASLIGTQMLSQVQDTPEDIQASMDVGMVNEHKLKVMVDGPSKMDYAVVEIDGVKQPEQFSEVGESHIYNMSETPSGDTSERDDVVVVGVLDNHKELIYKTEVKASV